MNWSDCEGWWYSTNVKQTLPLSVPTSAGRTGAAWQSPAGAAWRTPAASSSAAPNRGTPSAEGFGFDASKKAEPSCRISSSVHLCWELEEPKGPKGGRESERDQCAVLSFTEGAVSVS